MEIVILWTLYALLLLVPINGLILLGMRNANKRRRFLIMAAWKMAARVRR